MAKRAKTYAQRVEESEKRGAGLRAVAATGLISLIGGVGTYLGINYVGNKAVDYLETANREIQTLKADVRSLTGRVVGEYERAIEDLDETVETQTLNPSTGYAKPASLEEVDTLLGAMEDFKNHYGKVERIRQFKDRFDKLNLRTGEGLNKLEGRVGEGVYDKFAEWTRKITGQKKLTRKKIEQDRETHHQRMDSLCKLYDIEEDNLTTQTAVARALNKNLTNPNIPDEEKRLYRTLIGVGPEERELLIRNYKGIGLDRASEKELEEAFAQMDEANEYIEQNIEYLKDLHTNLNGAIEQRQEIRQETLDWYAQFKPEIEERVAELRGGLDNIIDGVEKINDVDVVTREEWIQRKMQEADGRHQGYRDNIVFPLALASGLLAGLYVAGKTNGAIRRTMKNRATRRTINRIGDMVEEQSQEIERLNEALDQKETKEANDKLNQIYQEDNEVEIPYNLEQNLNTTDSTN